jgi:hypothetical protein
MRVALLGCCLFAVVDKVFAHRLDEYLQATRIAVATNRIDLAFELTPGVAVAGQVLELIDKDRDGSFSDDEGSAYARQLLKDLKIGLDGEVVAASVTFVSFPAVREIRSGTGVIRIRATSAVGPLEAGNHALSLTNSHLPAISVYMVNALRSRDPAVEIGTQTRDELQKDYRLEFRVRVIRK